MARLEPEAYILDRQIFDIINTAIDRFTQSTKESVKELGQKFDEKMDALEKMQKPLEELIASYQKQIDELEHELSAINSHNFSNTQEGGYIDTSGIKAQIQELKRIKHIVDDNLTMLKRLYAKMSNQKYEYEQEEKVLDDLLEKDLPYVKSQLKSLDTIVEDYATSKLQL